VVESVGPHARSPQYKESYLLILTRGLDLRSPPTKLKLPCGVCSLRNDFSYRVNACGVLAGMKSRMRHVQPRESFYSGDEQARNEIRRYLQALASYPDRFAQNPDISFKKHLHSVVAASPRSPRRRN
jgi:hypothetical protein